MFTRKIRNRESGILLYGITPPKQTTAPEKVAEIAQRTLGYLAPLDLDALIVYDVQDESARTAEERPFPFTSALDPLEYASQYLGSLNIPKIIYRPASIFTREELTIWLDRMRVHGFQPVFVGLPSPDYVPKTSLSEAYEIWRYHHQSHSVMGAVVIPERHVVLKDEDVRILDKMSAGVTHFISQCIFDVACTQQTLEALIATCGEKKQPLPTIIFTLTICGSTKTLQFMEWLGIQVPPAIKDELMTCSNPTERSVEIATAISAYLIQYCMEKSIPFGFNIESVAIRKEEIQASLQLLRIVDDLLRQNGLRHESKRSVAASL
jgi:hypothetical protein